MSHSQWQLSESTDVKVEELFYLECRVSGQCGELSDQLEDQLVPGAQGERGEHSEGRGRGAAVPRRAGEVPHDGRVQEEAVRVPAADGAHLGHLGHVLKG